LLRIKSELFLLQGAPGTAAAAEDHYQQALGWARRQGALSWELRAATSLARLLSDQGRSADATALLQPVYDIVGPGRALMPVAGEPRRRWLRILASPTAGTKAIAISYERRSP
jgi:predicted ATPase